MDFIPDGNGVIVDGNAKHVNATMNDTITSCRHTLANSLGISVKIIKIFNGNISANLSRNERRCERIHKGLENKYIKSPNLV